MKNMLKKSEFRKDYFLNKYVLITPGRAKRPEELHEKETADHRASCDFCPAELNYNNVLDRIGKGKKWRAAAIRNIFPALSLDNKKAYGAQEVIIETPVHNQPLALLDLAQIETILKMHIKRIKKLEKVKSIKYILNFKNHGARAGASREHSHSQIFASAFIPPEIEEEMLAAKSYLLQNKTCPYCEITKKEAGRPREIHSDRNIIAFSPYASQYHYEAWLMAKEHLSDITKLNEKQIKSLAIALKKILFKLHSINLPYNFFFYKIVNNKSGHFVLKIQPRGSTWAGVELGSGIAITSVSPETAAEYYRS
jgi:UDPglucose--hexose-1-phosphate uridylyltransferase